MEWPITGGFIFGLILVFGVMPALLFSLIKHWSIRCFRYRAGSQMMLLALVSFAFLIPHRNSLVMVMDALLLSSGMVLERLAARADDDVYDSTPPDTPLRPTARVDEGTSPS